MFRAKGASRNLFRAKGVKETGFAPKAMEQWLLFGAPSSYILEQPGRKLVSPVKLLAPVSEVFLVSSASNQAFKQTGVLASGVAGTSGSGDVIGSAVAF